MLRRVERPTLADTWCYLSPRSGRTFAETQPNHNRDLTLRSEPYAFLSLALPQITQSRLKTGALQGVNIHDMPELAHFHEDMVFAESRFWGNEAVFGGL